MAKSEVKPTDVLRRLPPADMIGQRLAATIRETRELRKLLKIVRELNEANRLRAQTEEALK